MDMKRELTEKEAENFLEKEGFKVVKRALISSEEEIKTIEKQIKFPWVMKVSSSRLSHKAKLGGVMLGIDNQMKAQEAFDKLSKIHGFEECVIQETASGEEIIIGIKKTAEFGSVLMFGKGGSRVQEEKDVSFRAVPLASKDIREMIAETRISKILDEERASMKEIIKNIKLAEKLAKKYPNIIEFDINPLFVSQKSAKVADARIIFGE